jgi:hypothetical protein
MAKKKRTLDQEEPYTIEEIHAEFDQGEPWTLEEMREFFLDSKNQDTFVDFKKKYKHQALASRPPAISIHLTHAELEMTHHLMKISGTGERFVDTEGAHPRGVLNRSKTMQRIYRAGLLAILNEYAVCELTEKEVLDAYEYDGADTFRKKRKRSKPKLKLKK